MFRAPRNAASRSALRERRRNSRLSCVIEGPTRRSGGPVLAQGLKVSGLVDAGQGAGGLADCDAPRRRRDGRMPALSGCDLGPRRAILGRLVGSGLVPMGFLGGHGVSVASDRAVTRSTERSAMNGYSGISTVPWMLVAEPDRHGEPGCIFRDARPDVHLPFVDMKVGVSGTASSSRAVVLVPEVVRDLVRGAGIARTVFIDRGAYAPSSISVHHLASSRRSGRLHDSG